MLFRLVKAPNATGGILGYDFIDVIAAIPFALTNALTGEDYEQGRQGVSESWAKFGVEVEYICRTKYGLTKITSTDLWLCIEMGEYVEKDATEEAIEHAGKTRDMYADPPWAKEEDCEHSFEEGDVYCNMCGMDFTELSEEEQKKWN
jgi:hypothetical protein